MFKYFTFFIYALFSLHTLIASQRSHLDALHKPLELISQYNMQVQELHKQKNAILSDIDSAQQYIVEIEACAKMSMKRGFADSMLQTKTSLEKMKLISQLELPSPIDQTCFMKLIEEEDLAFQKMLPKKDNSNNLYTLSYNLPDPVEQSDTSLSKLLEIQRSLKKLKSRGKRLSKKYLEAEQYVTVLSIAVNQIHNQLLHEFKSQMDFSKKLFDQSCLTYGAHPAFIIRFADLCLEVFNNRFQIVHTLGKSPYFTHQPELASHLDDYQKYVAYFSKSKETAEKIWNIASRVPTSQLLLEMSSYCCHCGTTRDLTELSHACSKCTQARYCSADCKKGNVLQHASLCGTSKKAERIIFPTNVNISHIIDDQKDTYQCIIEEQREYCFLRNMRTKEHFNVSLEKDIFFVARSTDRNNVLIIHPYGFIEFLVHQCLNPLD